MAGRQCAMMFFFTVLLPIALAAVQNSWIYPDPNTTATYNYVDTVNTTWTSNFTNPYLLLWCQEQTTDSESPFSQEYNKSVPAVGSRLLPLDYGGALGCHFELHQYEGGDTGFNSGPVLIQVLKGKDPVAWSQDTQQSSATATPITSSAFPAAARTSSTSSASVAVSSAPARDSGLSTGAKAGIGIGVSLGVLAIGTMTALIVLRSRKKSRSQNISSGGEYEGDPVPKLYHPVDEMRVPHHELGVDPPEMPATEHSYELPASTIGGGHKPEGKFDLGSS